MHTTVRHKQGVGLPCGIDPSYLRAYGFGSHRVTGGLDGLRAVSICFVLLAHLTGTRGFPVHSGNLRMGPFGVRIFFVISGFLITSILTKEFDATRSISFRRFYFRRSMRLLPAAYVLIGAVSLAASYHLLVLARGDIPCAVAYVMNFCDNPGWSLGHLWSLAVEEQFYLLWPITLASLGRARASRFLIGLLFVAPLLRLSCPFVGPAFNFLVWTDALGAGCLLALLRQELAANPRYLSVLQSRRFFLVPIAAALASVIPSTKLEWLFGETMMNVGIAMTIDWVMRNQDGFVGRFLNSPAISSIGVLSYSLYLWQQPFLNRNSAEAFCSFPLNLILAFMAGLASFLLIETPFLRLRARLEQWVPRRSGDVATA